MDGHDQLRTVEGLPLDVALLHYLDALRGAGVEDIDEVSDALPAAAVSTFTKRTCGIATWQQTEPRSRQAWRP